MIGDTKRFGYYTQNGEGLEASRCTYTLDAAFDGAHVAKGVTAQTVESGGKTL